MVDMLRGERAHVGILRILRSLIEHLDVLLVLIDHVLDKLLIEVVARLFAEAFIRAVVIVVLVDLHVLLARDAFELGGHHLMIVNEFLRETFHLRVGGFFRGELGERDLVIAIVGRFADEPPIAPA